MPFGSGGSPRPHFSANDPNRPTAAYGHVPVRVGASSPAHSSSSAESGRKPADSSNQYPDYQQQQWPAPSSGSAAAKPVNASLKPATAVMSRMDSTASVMTTRATRGSPPPPETPVLPPPTNDIEARFAAAGFGRPGAVAAPAAPAPSAAAQQRTAQYSTPPPAQSTSQPATTYQVPGEPRSRSGTGNLAPLQSSPPGSSVTSVPPVRPSEHALEQDFSRMNVHDEPPPSYASIEPTSAASASYPNEKGRSANIIAPTPATAGVAAAAAAAAAATATTAAVGGTLAGGHVPNMNDHPAFQNDSRMQQGQMLNQSPSGSSTAGPSGPPKSASPAPSQIPASPPPLPEGWMAHLDTNSGQYYYIHLPTQSTQWEFPKGPNPLNLNEPLSPTGTFVNPMASPVSPTFSKPLASPGFGPVPQSATIRPDGYYSMASIASPTAAGFTAAPPVAGVDVYNVQPSNGVYFGPYLRYTNMDIESGLWLGSILL
ncbi:MAG TPA: hypothetical protein VHV10_14385, partial [Ktedonobacteraceae bacterium]|nr:hypothetical protein [Ktedonobacteraceae bacterium]